MFWIERDGGAVRICQKINQTTHVFRTDIDGLDDLFNAVYDELKEYSKEQHKSFEELDRAYWRDQGYGGSLWSDGQPDNLDYLGGNME
ncbi:hypothetical protein WJ437_09045 [Ignavigranum ruoffiae]|uniref:hypothetical protein n=1 Tax=Ignavigranum ruoffiae TaxID=89093 RepID=UPI003AFFB36E